MQSFSISFSRALASEQAALELAASAENEVGGPDRIAGALLLSTAAAGGQGAEVGRLLLERWPGAELLGTSFEGLVFEGQVCRDQPALGLLVWPVGDNEPALVAFEPGEQQVERIVAGILAASGQRSLGPADLVLLFPDAHGSPSIEPMLAELEAELGSPSIAGAAASGVGGEPPNTWVGGESWSAGGLVGLVVPAGLEAGSAEPLVRTAGGSRLASPWLAVTSGRSRWIDRLDDAPALGALRQAIGLGREQAFEPHLGRLLVRLRRGGRRADDLDPERFDEERYIVGVDERRGGFSLPVDTRRGDEIALAWPDAELARNALRGALDRLGDSRWLLQFACRSRDADLHGDTDVESAWVASHAEHRSVLGTVAPFQLGPGPHGRPARLLVHSNVLAALVSS